MEIHQHAYDLTEGAKFSILIPTWNNLPYLQLCVDSLRRHSTYPHQLVIHVNDGSDGTMEWVEEQRIDHTWSEGNVGICHALNAAAKLAQTPYICFFNDDMVALPGWDAALLEEIQSLDHERWFLSATMIEPTYTGNGCALSPHDFGREAKNFREADLLKAYQQWEKTDWCGSTWPPNVLPRQLWEMVGGYSVEFSPGISSDPDFSMKLWQIGVRHFKGISQSRVYHFQAKSTGKVEKNDGPRQFLRKWNTTQGTFGKYYLRRGKKWNGPLPEPGPRLPLLWAKIKAFFKKRLS
jgi:glycosyltransferase involved in cell wall biosynthesis